MTTQSDEILGIVNWLVITEVLETLVSREVEGTDDSSIMRIGMAVAVARDARFSLLPLMEEAAKWKDGALTELSVNSLMPGLKTCKRHGNFTPSFNNRHSMPMASMNQEPCMLQADCT